MSKPILFTLILLQLLIFQGCSSEKQTPEQENVFGNRLEVKNLWVRSAAENANSAGYMDILNGTEQSDTLLAVDADGVSKSEVHESYTTEDGLSGMRPAKALVVPPGSSLKLQPGSFHLMLMGLEQDLQPGDSLQITLQFAKAGFKTQKAVVRE